MKEKLSSDNDGFNLKVSVGGGGWSQMDQD